MIGLNTFLKRGWKREEAIEIRRILSLYDEREVTWESALELIDGAMTDGYGVESIPEGSNQKSPEIHYVNTGDSYGETVLFINGRFRLGNWGDIVERGNYS